MSTKAQVVINLPSLRKMLMKDMAWVSDNALNIGTGYQITLLSEERLQLLVVVSI